MPLVYRENCPCWVNPSSVKLCFKILHKELDTTYIHIVPTHVYLSLSLFLTKRKWNPNFRRQRKFTGHKVQKRIRIKVFPLFGNPVHPSLQRKGEPCPIIINTYFRVFPRSPTHSLCVPDNWPFNGSPQYNTVCAQADCNQSPSFQRDNSYLFSAERIDPFPIPTRSILCCFLLLWFAFICFQHYLNAAIVCCWNVPKQRNKNGEQKDDFLTSEWGWGRKRDRQDGGEAKNRQADKMAAFTAHCLDWMRLILINY